MQAKDILQIGTVSIDALERIKHLSHPFLMESHSCPLIVNLCLPCNTVPPSHIIYTYNSLFTIVKFNIFLNIAINDDQKLHVKKYPKIPLTIIILHIVGLCPLTP